MIETERTERALLADGTWASPDDALKTMSGIYRALSSRAIPNNIATVVEMRTRVSDLESFVKDAASPRDPAGDYIRRKINDTLMSPIFELDGVDPAWTVPPKTALAVLRSMVVVDVGEDSTELFVQEPFPDRELLPAAWKAFNQY